MEDFRIHLVGPKPQALTIVNAFSAAPVETSAHDYAVDVLSEVDAGEVDCIVSDYELADGDGLALVSSVRHREPSLPFVLYPHTDIGDERLASEAITRGVTDYVPGDAEPETLIDRAVDAARRGSRSASEPDLTPGHLQYQAMNEAPVGVTIADVTVPDEPLVYVNDAFERITGYERWEVLGRNCRFLQGEDTDPDTVSRMRQAIEGRQPITVELLNYRKDGEPFWNRVEIAPLGEEEPGEITHLVGFQSDVTERKEAELRAERQATELRSQRRDLQRLLSRIKGLMADITEAAIETTERGDLERAVCERFIGAGYRSAWIGRRQLTGKQLVASTAAGYTPIDGSQIRLPDETSSSSPPADPTVRAFHSSEVVIADSESLLTDSVHSRLLPAGGSIAAIPLQYREATYGILTVYTDRSMTFDDYERTVLESIGRVGGGAIDSLRNRRLLTDDEVRRLAFESTNESFPLMDLSRCYECRLEYADRVPSGNDGRGPILFTAREATPDALEAAAKDPDVTVIAKEDAGAIIEYSTQEGGFLETVIDNNGIVREMTISDGTAELVVDVPNRTDPRPIIEAIRQRYPGTELVTQRQDERLRRTDNCVIEQLREQLTDRQYAALRRAHLSGYFEWSRPVKGEALAKSMGITRSTFHEHLRTAQRKIFDSIFDAQGGSP
ncbi:bacterio-opsin activator domain-containing protein [Halorubrum sp. AD140]|uniref:bacterio-opsin activator domain-containing protein n=1 Tax=Halorubrum sp. AD140 TaxID=3050073 RepID=UPI002ACC9D15|nr:bacterio-opsin activator domain-containing protein [Halorubrum sp. AD140]MDZ5811563.1 bacterio-opsin activator domain-containing protein [Halorubrum sp. AD140]